jgi:peptidoglycan/LPS O-acetylase OafA/YrhL
MHGRRLDQIQLLRAVAALAVVMAHIPELAVRGGFGVDLFFVISGFIIVYVTEDEPRAFLLKRIFRIVPIYWLGTFAIFAVTVFMPSLTHEATTSGAYLLKSLFFIPFAIAPDRFGPYVILGWTLNHEVFFYVLFWGALQVSHRYRALICSGLIIAVVLAAKIPRFGQLIAFEGDPIILEFIYGMGSYWAFRRWGAQAIGSIGQWGAIGLAAVIYCALLMWVEFGVRPVSAGIPSLIVFLLVLFAGRGIRFPRWILLIGDASYSLYLFHPYVLNAFSRMERVLAIPPRMFAMAAIPAIGACIVFAISTWLGIERPSNIWLRKHLLGARVPAVLSV